MITDAATVTHEDIIFTVHKKLTLCYMKVTVPVIRYHILSIKYIFISTLYAALDTKPKWKLNV